MEDGFHSYCDKVCSLIRRPSAREAARKELLAHLEDHAAVLEERGIPADLAARQAVESMGDPYALGRCHDSLLPRLSRLQAIAACVLFFFGFMIGLIQTTGYFRHENFLLPASSLPCWPSAAWPCSSASSSCGSP